MSTAKDSKLVSIVQENVEVERNDILMTSIDRRYWAETTGYEYLQQLAFPDDIESLKISIGGNYFAACCFAAVGWSEEARLLSLTCDRLSDTSNSALARPLLHNHCVSSLRHRRDR